MTENKRIILNTLATYGRSLYSLALGLFSARWVLEALGKVDLGLLGVVGSILFCITFISGMLSGSISRFYAFSVGQERKIGGEEGRDKVSAWFNAALSIYTILPIILIGIGYPIGIYAIHHWLVIPPERVNSCVFVFRMSLLSAFVGMVSLPYISMYRAYQLITELSFWGILGSTLTFICAYILLHVDGDRLIIRSLMLTSVGVGIALIQVVRARKHFPACRIQTKYLMKGDCIRQLFSYSFWEFFGCVGDLLRGQGTVFLINRHMGPTMNAAYTIGNQVSNHTQTLSSALLGALSPAVSTAAGADEKQRAISLAFRSCKFCTLLILVFCIPLILEVDEVLRLWLVNPPEGASTICVCILIAAACHKLGWGHHILVCSYGRIRGMQTTLGVISAATVILIWAFLHMGFGMLGVGLSFIISFSFLTLVRVAFARSLLGMSVRYWAVRIVVPILIMVAVAFPAGLVARSLMEPSFWRVCLTTVVSLSCSLPVGWFLVLDRTERLFVTTGLMAIKKRFA